MTENTLNELFALKVELDKINHNINLYNSIKRDANEIIIGYIQNVKDDDINYCALPYDKVYVPCRRREELDYIKLVKKGYNSKEIEMTPQEWNDLLDNAILFEESKRNKLMEQLRKY